MKNRVISLIAISVIVASCGSANQATGSTSSSDGLVDIGYGHLTKSGNPYAVAKVEPENEAFRHYNSIYDMLTNIPGVHVSGSTVTVRGANSINASTDPLFVVDGTPVNSVSNMNPDEVHHIEVLKDGSSAMYGMRGAGGVIMITTKSAYAAQQAEKEARAAAREAKKAAKKK